MVSAGLAVMAVIAVCMYVAADTFRSAVHFRIVSTSSVPCGEGWGFLSLSRVFALSGERGGVACVFSCCLQEWQFYDRARIEQLHTAELNFYRNQGNAKPPTDEEREEKQRLLREGFGSWGKRDFIQFVR